MIDPFVDIGWWRQHAHDVVTADVRWYLDGRSGADAYAAGHLPGAVFVDLDRWLAGHGDPAAGRHPLPTPETFAEGMGTLGIGDDDTVVAYDDAGGVIAARLVWMLRATGHAAAVLDGGLQAYDGELERTKGARVPARFTARPWPTDRIAEITALHASGRILLDARDRNRYSGEFEPVDPRPGHIPGAQNVPAREMLDPDGRLLPASILRDQLARAGVTAGSDVVASCGSGVTACHTLLVLEALGISGGRLYPGSYSEWSHTSRPVET